MELANAKLPNNLKTIGPYAFYGCSSVKEVSIPAGVTYIGYDAFYECSALKTVTFAKDIQIDSIGVDVFYGCSSLTGITIPDSVTSIGQYAFYDCGSLTSITIPDGVTSVGDNAFSECCSLTSIMLPGSLTSIGNHTFQYCYSLESVTIADGVTGIGQYAFYDCNRLTSITIPASVTSIEYYAFGECSGLSMYFEGSAPTIDSGAFDYSRNLTVYYPVCDSSWDGVAGNEYGASSITWTGIHYPTAAAATVVAPTCTADGSSTQTCRLCGAVYGETIPATGHDWQVTASTPATCQKEGSADYRCANCGNTKTETLAIDTADGHDWVLTRTEAPTCAAQGYTLYTCSICGNTKRVDYVPALGHSYGDPVETNPSCASQGYTTHTCDTCGYSYRDNYTDALGHNYSATVVKPTCQTQGYTLYECSACGDCYYSDYTEPSAHELVTTTIAPTCTTRGYDSIVCSVCGYAETANFTPALGHSYTDVVTPPTCTSQGYTTRTCATCGESYKTYFVPMTAHNYVLTVTPSSCTARGFTTWTCTDCGDTKVGDYTAILDHNWDNGEVTSESYLVGGKIVYTCLDCGVTYTVAIPAIGQIDLSDCTIELSYTSAVYSGNAKEPTVKVMTDDGPIDSDEYTVTYSDNIDAGTATVTVTAKEGDISVCGSAKAEFTITRKTRYITASLSDELVHMGGTALVMASAGDASLSYSSSNPDILTVSDSGVITPLARGTASVIISAAETANYKAATRSVIVKVTDHDWVSVDQVASETSYTTTYNCSICGLSKEETSPIEISNVARASLTLGASVGVNFYMTLSSEADKVVMNGPSGEIEAPVADAKIVDGYYRFTYEVPAKDMDEEITLEVKNASGQTLALSNLSAKDNVLHYSVSEYLANAAGSSDASLVALASAMNSYGTAAGAYFGGEDVSYDGAAVDLSGYKSTVTGTGAAYYGSSLLLKEEVTIRHYFTANPGTVTVSVGDSTETLEVKQKDGLWYVDIKDIAAIELGTPCTVSAGDWALSYSALSYCYKAMQSGNDNLKALVENLYQYHLAAKDYFAE